MKNILFILLVSSCFANCATKKNAIHFISLNEGEFNSKPFAMPEVPTMDSLRRAHDSCMGYSFNAKAFLAQKRDSFFVGSIVNRRTLKIVNTLSDLNLTVPDLMTKFNIITKPCYEKRNLNAALKLLLGENFMLHFSNVDEGLNKAVSNLISTSGNADIQAGSWVYMDMRNALTTILDTTTNAKLLQYKQNLLDTSNMTLTAIQSVTNVSFIINTENDISEPLQTLLKSKPSESWEITHTSVQLFLISSNRFQMTINGFFPVVGEFMRAEMN